MTQRRQVGFIRTYSHKNLQFQDEPSQFSYFKIKGGKDDEEFSPYKFEEKQSTKDIKIPPKQVAPKPPLPERRTLKDKISSYLHGKAQAQEYYQKIKRKIASYEEKQSSSKQKLQQNIGNIRNKIERLDEVLKDLKSNKEHSVQKRPNSSKKSIEKHKVQKDSSSSSSEQDVVVKAIPSPKIVDQSSKLSSKQRISSQKSKQRFQIQQNLSKGVKFLEKQDDQEQFSRQNDSSRSKQKNEHNENVIAFNSRIKNQPPLYIKSYSSSSSSETQERQERQERQEMQENNYLQTRNMPVRQIESKPQFFKNRGGVCFEVDVKQFTAPIPADKKERQFKPKKQKVDKKAEILKRRQTARAYDKMTRRAIFSPY